MFSFFKTNVLNVSLDTSFFQGFITLDTPAFFGYSFQKAATPVMEGISHFHSDLLLILILISLLVTICLGYILYIYKLDSGYHTNIYKDDWLENAVLETIWTIIPTLILILILIPSLALLFSTEDLIKSPYSSYHIIGRQWYWSYEYPDLDVVYEDNPYLLLLNVHLKAKDILNKIFQEDILFDSDEQAEDFLKKHPNSFLAKSKSLINESLQENLKPLFNFVCHESTRSTHDSLDPGMIQSRNFDRLFNIVRYRFYTEDQYRFRELNAKNVFPDTSIMDTHHSHLLLEFKDILDKNLSAFLTPSDEQINLLRTELFGLSDEPSKVQHLLHDSIEDELKKLFSELSAFEFIEKVLNINPEESNLRNGDSSSFNNIEKTPDETIYIRKLDPRFEKLNLESDIVQYVLKTYYQSQIKQVESLLYYAIRESLLDSYRKHILDKDYIIKYDSYIIPKDEIDFEEKGQLRNLSVDAPLVLPSDVSLKLLITSSDVIHSWALPSAGIKVDACPGRLNQCYVRFSRPGTFYGQCSEICGVSHALMPIQVVVLPKSVYENYMVDSTVNFSFVKEASKQTDPEIFEGIEDDFNELFPQMNYLNTTDKIFKAYDKRNILYLEALEQYVSFCNKEVLDDRENFINEYALGNFDFVRAHQGMINIDEETLALRRKERFSDPEYLKSLVFLAHYTKTESPYIELDSWFDLWNLKYEEYKDLIDKTYDYIEWQLNSRAFDLSANDYDSYEELMQMSDSKQYRGWFYFVELNHLNSLYSLFDNYEDFKKKTSGLFFNTALRHVQSNCDTYFMNFQDADIKSPSLDYFANRLLIDYEKEPKATQKAIMNHTFYLGAFRALFKPHLSCSFTNFRPALEEHGIILGLPARTLMEVFPLEDKFHSSTIVLNKQGQISDQVSVLETKTYTEVGKLLFATKDEPFIYDRQFIYENHHHKRTEFFKSIEDHGLKISVIKFLGSPVQTIINLTK